MRENKYLKTFYSCSLQCTVTQASQS